MILYYVMYYTILYHTITLERPKTNITEALFTLLDLCVSSFPRGHANNICIVPMSTDDPRRESFWHVGCWNDNNPLNRFLIKGSATWVVFYGCFFTITSCCCCWSLPASSLHFYLIAVSVSCAWVKRPRSEGLRLRGHSRATGPKPSKHIYIYIYMHI